MGPVSLKGVDMKSSKKTKKTSRTEKTKKTKLRSALIMFGLLMFMVGSVRADGILSLLMGHMGHYVNGSGDLITESRDVSDFTEIEVSGPFDVLVTCGEDQTVTITIDDNLMDLITTKVRRGVLEIKCEESFSAHRRSIIEISLPELEALALHGSGDVRVQAAKGDELEFDLHGSGTIEVVDINAELLLVTIAGSGEFVAEGKADEVEVRVSGSGDIDLRELIADDASVRISGSGDVEVYAVESFSGRVTGSGDIRIHGNPKRFTEKVSGSGDIRRM